MKNFCLIILFVLISCNNKKYIDIETLPQWDCQLRNAETFADNDTVVFLIPSINDSLYYKGHLKGWASRFDFVPLFRYESEMNDKLYSIPIWIIGPINGYANWDLLNVPISKTEDGYTFDKINYSDSLDGIFYIDEKRIIFTGNSLESVIFLTEQLLVGYNFVQSYGKRIISFGNIKTDSIYKIERINIAKLVENNYNLYRSKYYNIYLSKKTDKSLDKKQLEFYD